MADRTIEKYREILRGDLHAFAHRSFLELNPSTKLRLNPYLEVLASKLESVRRGEIKRLIVNMPPRSLKSHFASIAFPAWLLGHDPSAQIIAVSYAQDFADRLARECRRLMLSPFYQSLFATRLSSEKQAVAEFETTENGFRVSTSPPGVLTGRGADYAIIDDALKPDEALSEVRRRSVNEWFDSSLYTRLNNKASGAIIVIMQRLHEDDLVGHLLSSAGWELLAFPAIAERDQVIPYDTPYGPDCYSRKTGEAINPDFESLETLNRTREIIGPYNFAGQYQQAPAPYGGGYVKEEWFRSYDQLPSGFDTIIQSWDTASVPAELNSYSVCTTWGLLGRAHYLIDVWRGRLDYPGLKQAVCRLAGIFKANVVLIENRSSGIQLIQELTHEGVRGITKYEPTGDKETRMVTQTATIESGRVHLPRQAPWLADYLHELVTFPKGTYSDQVDSTSQALDWIKSTGIRFDAWLQYYKEQGQSARGISAPVELVVMRAPGPYLNYYMSGTNGRAGRYSSDGDCIIENVHPDDVERLLQQGCVQVPKNSLG